MALNKQQLDFTFDKGVDRKTHPYLVEADDVHDLRNAVINKEGVCVKRNGTTLLATPTFESQAIPNTRRLIEYNGGLVMLDGVRMWSYEDNNDEWIDIGSCPLMEVEETQIHSEDDWWGTSAGAVSIAEANGMLFVCTASHYWVLDKDTKNTIVGKTFLPGISTILPANGSLTGGRVVSLSSGTVMMFVYPSFFSVSGSIRWARMATNDPTGGFVSSGILVSDGITSAGDTHFDVVAASSTVALLGYFYETGGNQYTKFGHFTSTGTFTAVVTGSTAILDPSTNNSPCCVAVVNNPGDATDYHAHFLWMDSNGDMRSDELSFTSPTYAAENTGQLVATKSGNWTRDPDALVAIEDPTDNGELLVWMEEPPANGDDLEETIVHELGVPTAGYVGEFMRSAGIGTRPFMTNRFTSTENSAADTDVYIGLVTDTSKRTGTGYPDEVFSYQTMYFLNARKNVVGRALVDRTGPATTNGVRTTTGEAGFHPWCGIVEDSGTSNKFVFARPTSVAGLGSFGGLDVVTLDFNRGGRSTEVNDVLLVSSGILWTFDGVNCFEINPLWKPSTVYAAAALGTGGLLAGEEYLVGYDYIYSDAKKNARRGAFSPLASEIPSGAEDEIDVDCQTLRLANNPLNSSSLLIRLYRSEDSGSVLYYDSYTQNDTTTHKVTLDTDQVDALLTDNSTAYITGGVLDHEHPPPGGFITTLANRWMMVGQRDTLYYSSLIQEEIMAGYSTAFRQLIPAVDGKLVAVIQVGAQIIAFKETGIYRFYGEGPNDTGGGQSYSTPEVVSRNAGARDDTPVHLMDEGVLFQSDKGLWLLRQNLQLDYIGAPMEEYFDKDTGSKVKCFSEAEDENQLQVCLDGKNYTAVLDTLQRRWSRNIFTGTEVLAVTRWDNKWVYAIDNSGTLEIHKEDTSYTDDTDDIEMRVSTPWLRMQQLNGFHRLWWIEFLGRWKSAHTLNFEIYYDYNTTVVQTATFDLSSGYSANDPIRLRIKPSRQRCESVKIIVYDSDQAGTKQSLDMIGLSFTMGMKRKRGLAAAASS